MQSKIRNGFVSARRRQSPHRSGFRSPSAASSARPNAGRHARHPTELTTSSVSAIPSARTSAAAISITSASSVASETPNTSTSSWWNCR